MLTRRTNHSNAPRAITYKGATYEKVAAEGKPLPKKDVLASMFWKDPSMKDAFFSSLGDAADKGRYEENLYSSAEKTLKKAGFTINEDHFDENTITEALWILYKKAMTRLKSNWE